MARTFDPLSAAAVREDERGFAAAVHFPMGAIPLWGLVFLAGMWMFFKERSREIVFHIQQAMVFHMVQMAAWLCWIAISLLEKPIGFLSETVARLLETLNLFMLITFLTAYAAVCLWGCAATLVGKPFLYPVIGRRVLEGSLAKTLED